MLKMVETSPKTYKKVYIDGVPMGTNRGMALGTEIANALEHDEDTGDIVKDMVLAQIRETCPDFDLHDVQQFMELTVGKERVPMRIQPDLAKSSFTAFKEVKTGAGPWTQKIVNENSQITYYALGMYLLTKKIPTDMELIWAPTKKVVGLDGIERPELTGEIKRFKTTRSHADMLRMMIRVRNAWKKIGEIVEKELI